MMNNIVGQPVESDDFFNRETEVNAVWESLEQGNHVLLLAPRRVVGPEEHRAAVAVLNALCQRPDGLPRQALRDELATRLPDPSQAANLLSTVLGLLERDGYLLRVDGERDSATRYAFRSFLLKRYWYTREVE